MYDEEQKSSNLLRSSFRSMLLDLRPLRFPYDGSITSKIVVTVVAYLRYQRDTLHYKYDGT